MKRQRGAAPVHVISEEGLRTFYGKLWLPLAAKFVLEELAMLGGGCSMEQRELVLQYWEYPCRNNVFRSVADVVRLLEDALQHHRYLPINIHFGPVWPALHMALQPLRPPSKDWVVPEFAPNVDMLKPRAFERKERGDSARGELVLDVDMPVARRIAVQCCDCGDEARVCETCWTIFMLPAQRILTYLVRNFFAFKRCFSVFSGRRGFHLWIMDPRVLDWTFHERRAFIAHITAPLTRAHRDPLSDFIWETVIKPEWDAHPSWATSREEAFTLWYPELDQRVSTAPDHMHKLPLMLNAYTGYFCDVLADPDDERYRFVASPDQLITLDRMKPHIMLGCIAYLQRVLSEK